MIWEVTEYLGIACFTVRKKDEKGVWRRAAEVTNGGAILMNGLHNGLNGYANGHSNGHANGHTNGHANGHTNGHANGHANGLLPVGGKRKM